MSNAFLPAPRSWPSRWGFEPAEDGRYFVVARRCPASSGDRSLRPADELVRPSHRWTGVFEVVRSLEGTHAALHPTKA